MATNQSIEVGFCAEEVDQCEWQFTITGDDLLRLGMKTAHEYVESGRNPWKDGFDPTLLECEGVEQSKIFDLKVVGG